MLLHVMAIIVVVFFMVNILIHQTYETWGNWRKNPRMPEIERKYKIECEDGGFLGERYLGNHHGPKKNMVKYGDMDGLYTKTCFVLRVAGCVLF